jgi:ribonuclease J
MAKNTPNRPENGLYFVPLGGAGEIGMNLTLYGCDGKWLMVDLGVTFGDDTMPGIDVLMPDPTFIAEQRDNLVGIVITHGHEDHLGAIEYLWPYLQCPVYATPFTAGLLRAKLSEQRKENRDQRQVRIIEIPVDGNTKIGPFDLQFINITHSIPEASCIAIKTKYGNVLHTGDWKLDATPMLGQPTNIEALKKLGDEGVLAAVVDSTNALVPGHSGSEQNVRAELHRVFGKYNNRIVVTCFASNVARLLSIYSAARAHDREVVLVGRSLIRIEEVARDTGYIPEDIMFHEAFEAGFLPRDKAVYICTGSQGEKRSALSRLANGEHRDLVLESGDVVLFSSRDIPGNEKAIASVQNSLIRNGIQVITVNEEPIHVSGHPCQEELVQMYQWLRPKVAIPVHGEARHQAENARIAASCQVPGSIIAHNGDMYRIAPGSPEKVGEVQAGRWVIDGTKIRPLDDASIKARQKMMGSGVATVSLVLNEKGQLLLDPQVSLIGFGEDEGDEIDHLADLRNEVAEAFEKMPKSQRLDDVAIQHAVRLAVRRLINESFGRKPVTEVHVSRV